MNIRETLMDGEKKAEFDSNYFSPSYIMTIFVPTWAKSPGVPLIIEDNTNAPGRGSVYPEFNGGDSRWFG